jgi:hypothetical protein
MGPAAGEFVFRLETIETYFCSSEVYSETVDEMMIAVKLGVWPPLYEEEAVEKFILLLCQVRFVLVH